MAGAQTVGTPMTWGQYEQLGDDVRGEYIDGRLVMSPSPSRQHQQICQRLVAVVAAAVPTGFEVTAGWAWKPRDDEFIPDVMVHEATAESVRFTGTPALVVEVLSTNRADDLVTKTSRYASLGLTHYWIVDPRDEVIDTFELSGTVYRHVARLAEGAAELSFGVAAVDVDVRWLIRGEGRAAR